MVIKLIHIIADSIISDITWLCIIVSSWINLSDLPFYFYSFCRHSCLASSSLPIFLLLVLLATHCGCFAEFLIFVKIKHTQENDLWCLICMVWVFVLVHHSWLRLHSAFLHSSE